MYCDKAMDLSPSYLIEVEEDIARYLELPSNPQDIDKLDYWHSLFNVMVMRYDDLKFRVQTELDNDL